MRDLLKNLPEGVLTEDTLNAIETAFSDRVKIHVEKALTQQDELYAEKLQTLIEAIDKDHTNKLQKVVEAIDINNTEKLKQVIVKYEKDLSKDAGSFKESLITNISNYLEVCIEEAIPTQDIKEAVRNRQALLVLENLRKTLSVDSALINASIREAVIEGKQQIDESAAAVATLQKENAALKLQVEKTTVDKLLESLTLEMSPKKKGYMKKILSDKSAKFIQENFDYTSKLFDKKETERLEVLKEEAFQDRVVKTDSPKIVETPVTKKSTPVDSYLGELQRVR